MAHPSRDYTRLLNTLIDHRIAEAGRRSPWFHMTPGERADYLAEVDRRLLEMQRTTLNILAAQYYTTQDKPRAIDEHLDLLRRYRAQLDRQETTPARDDYGRRLDGEILLYVRQQAAMQGFEQAWRKALKLLVAGNGLAVPCQGLLVRLQRLGHLAQRKLDAQVVPGEQRTQLFARAQGWQTVTERYRAVLDAPLSARAAALAALEEIPAASDELPVNLSLLLMEERPGYVRLNVALVDPSDDGRFKDLYLDHGKLVVQANGVMNFSFGTTDRSLSWQQQYRLKHEPAHARSPTFAPIRSVLVRTGFVVDLLGLYLVSEQTLRKGFLVQVLNQGARIRVLNVDRKVPNQVAMQVFNERRTGHQVRNVDLPHALNELLDRYADISSFQTIALESYARTHYDPDRDGTFVSLRQWEQALGFGERLYLLELHRDGRFLAATPFAAVTEKGSHLLSVSELRRVWVQNGLFFLRLEQLREMGREACPWFRYPLEHAAFCAQWLRLLERNHLTPGGILTAPEVVRDSLRDIKGNHLGKVLWERAFAHCVWHWPPLETLLFGLGENLVQQGLAKLLGDAYLQATVGRAGQLLGALLEPMGYRVKALTLLRLLLLGETALTDADSALCARAGTLLDSNAGRALRRQAVCQVLVSLARHSDQSYAPINSHPPLGDSPWSGRRGAVDPYLILNSRSELTDDDWLIAEDKYRGYHQFVHEPDSLASRYMESLDSPFVAGISPICAVLSGELPQWFGRVPAPEDYWRFQLAISAFLLRNGHHGFFETIYVAARYEPPWPGAIGVLLLALFDRCREPGTGSGALYQGAMALILPLVNRDIEPSRQLKVARFGLFGPQAAGEQD
ncbi:hypothetical protein [Pseudomonas sp. Irchel 3E13]|uniref:hypothetical protein n=1 Tax=Pseudomonas sp. Irchel 3E13 TaxID=2008975 RepID=UPI000BA3741D|nr:hypothetical protein [Pseudomonas sp. Irchel 3E13]